MGKTYQRGYKPPPIFFPRNFGSLPYYQIANNSCGTEREYETSGSSRIQPAQQSSCSPLCETAKTHPSIPFQISSGVAPKYAQGRGYEKSGPLRKPLIPPAQQSSHSPLCETPKVHPCIPFLISQGRGYEKLGSSKKPLIPPAQQSSHSPLCETPKVHPCIPFLISCGVAPKHAKNLPLTLVNIIGPNFCGACDKNLINFEQAKDHYVSKAHHVKQKKYISGKLNEPGCVATNCPAWKMPFTLRRSIYCELCDVRIMSKVHANLHYTGKSHKAIVYEKEPPKNKLLLWKAMKKRMHKILHQERNIYNRANEKKMKGGKTGAPAGKPGLEMDTSW